MESSFETSEKIDSDSGSVSGNIQDSQAQVVGALTAVDVPAIKTPPDDKVVSNTLSFIPKGQTIIDGDMEGFINTILDQVHAKLLMSKSIEDVANAFKQLDERIGKAEFIIAIMISFIREEKLWKQNGYSSMNKFLDDLPDVCKVSRQTFANAAQAGEVILFLSSPMTYLLLAKDNITLTPAFFYRNYAKIKFLYRIKFLWKQTLTKEILFNFRDMTYREFENYVNEYEQQHRGDIERCSDYYRKHPKKKGQSPQPKKKKEIPKLNEEETEICHELRLGHTIGFAFCPDTVCIDSVSKCLRNMSKQEYDDRYRRRLDPFKIFRADAPDICLWDRDWTELYEDSSAHNIEVLTEYLRAFSPLSIKNALAERFKTKTELTLAQAWVINRLQRGFDPDLYTSLFLNKDHYKIQHKFGLSMDFAISVLDIDIPRYKWLKRLGGNLACLTRLKGEVRFTSEGFLEKLSYLVTALNNHSDLRLIVDAFNTLSAKRFREFARDPLDDLSGDPITMRDYLRAEPFLKKLRVYQDQGKSVSIMGLRSELECGFLDKINGAMRNGEECLKKWFPDIVWNPDFEVEVLAA